MYLLDVGISAIWLEISSLKEYNAAFFRSTNVKVRRKYLLDSSLYASIGRRKER